MKARKTISYIELLATVNGLKQKGKTIEEIAEAMKKKYNLDPGFTKELYITLK